jgi:hypothetical protein
MKPLHARDALDGDDALVADLVRKPGRTTFVGSMMPESIRSQYSSFCASKPAVIDLPSSSLLTTRETSTPAFSRI